MNKSFTLIELLIVIAIIAIIAGAVLVAINPAKRLAQASDSARWSEVRSILTAVNTYIVDNKGDVPDCGASGNLPNDNRWYVIGTAGGTDYTDTSGGPPGSNCIAAWLLDTDEDPVDVCGTNDGTLNGPTYTTAGRDGGAFIFDGDDDYVDVGNLLSSGISELTITAWIQTLKIGQLRIICKSSGTSTENHTACILVDDNNNIEVRIKTTSDVNGNRLNGDSNTLTVGKWSHVAFTYKDGDGVKIYVDGSLNSCSASKGSCTPTGNLVVSGQVVVIGNVNTVDSRYFDGFIDEVAIFNTALDPDQIREIYYYGLAGEFCNLSPDLASGGGYLSKIPEDPTNGDLDGTGISGYLIKRSPSGTIFVRAPHASQYTTQEIMVSR